MAATELLEDARFPVEPGMPLEGSPGKTEEEELLDSSFVLGMTLAELFGMMEDELFGDTSEMSSAELAGNSEVSLVTELELRGVTMLESDGLSAGPELFESEEQDVRIVHAAATVKNGIPNFLNMP